MWGADRRAAKVLSEYTGEEKKADESFGALGISAAREAPQSLPQVRGIALRAFGEFSEPASLFMEGLAHEVARPQ